MTTDLDMRGRAAATALREVVDITVDDATTTDALIAAMGGGHVVMRVHDGRPSRGHRRRTVVVTAAVTAAAAAVTESEPVDGEYRGGEAGETDHGLIRLRASSSPATRKRRGP